MQLFAETHEVYRRFAVEVGSESPCFTAWALGVAEDPEVQSWLAQLPVIKRQPNLVFAAARWHGVPAPGPYDALSAALLGDDGSIRSTILDRATQTNEVGRLATLVPLLGLVDGPLALLEVGASAGLCLYPDRYDYRWAGGRLSGSGGLELTCRTSGPVPIPRSHPRVVWRGGIDLHPLDVGDNDQMAWLTTLVWPEQAERRERLRAAIEITRADPPRLVTGDLLERLPEVLEEAGRHGTPVVFHSAVLAYLPEAERFRFHDLMTGLVTDGACHWISNEGHDVLPQLLGTTEAGNEAEEHFVAGLDGRALALTHGHGASMVWL